MGSIIQAKVELTGIAAMALGSGRTEGRSGGEGHIGMIGNRAVKFNTHSNEYSKNSLATLEKENIGLFNQMKTSSDVLRARLRQIGNSIKEAGSGNYENLKTVLDEVLDADNAKWSDKGLLKRKAVAKAVTEINKFLGGTANEEVWGRVESIRKSLQTRDINDTRALFTASQEQATSATPQAEVLRTNAAAALKMGTKRFVSQDVAEAGQRALDNYQENSRLGRPDFRANRVQGGEPEMVSGEMENQAAEFDYYGFDNGDFVSKDDFPKVLLFDRLCAINAGVKAMVKTAHESFPGCELDQFFGYDDGKVFDDIVKGLDKQSVDVYGARSAVDVKGYGVALQKLQDHFMKVALRLGADATAIGNGNVKGVAQAAARELSMQIVAFLKRQTENTGFGEIQTLRECNPNYEFVYHDYTYEKDRSHDVLEDNKAWNRQMTVKLNDGGADFWVSDIVGTNEVQEPSLERTLLDSGKLSSRVLLPNRPSPAQGTQSSSIPDLLKSCSPVRLDASSCRFLDVIVAGLKDRIASTIDVEVKGKRRELVNEGLAALQAEKPKLEEKIREELTNEIKSKFEQNEEKQLREMFSIEFNKLEAPTLIDQIKAEMGEEAVWMREFAKLEDFKVDLDTLREKMKKELEGPLTEDRNRNLKNLQGDLDTITDMIEISDKRIKDEVNARLQSHLERYEDEKIKPALEERIKERIKAGLADPQDGVESRLNNLLDERLKEVRANAYKAAAAAKSSEYQSVIPGEINKALAQLGVDGIKFKMANGDDMTGGFVFTDQKTAPAEMEKLVRAFKENPAAAGQEFDVDVDQVVKPALEQLQKDLQQSDDELYNTIAIPDDLHEYGMAPGEMSTVDDEYEILVREKCSGRSRLEAIRLVLNYFSRTSQQLYKARGGQMHVIGAYKRILEEITQAIDESRNGVISLPDFNSSIDNYLSVQKVPAEMQAGIKDEAFLMRYDLQHALEAIDRVYGTGVAYERKTYAPIEEHKVFLDQLSDAIKDARANNSRSRKEVMLKWDDAFGWKIVAEIPASDNGASDRAKKLRAILQFMAGSIDPALSIRVKQHLERKLSPDTLQKIYDEFAVLLG